MRFILILCLWLIPQMALAIDFVSGTNGAINGSTQCNGTELLRTFSVSPAFTVADIDVGFKASHTWRGDINLRLTSPLGTTVQLVTPNVNGPGNIDNYNVRFDDDAVDLVNTGNHAGPDSTTAPLYPKSVRPSNPLSAFNGEAAAGTWTLSICDAFPGADNGIFDIATLFISEDPAPPTGNIPLSCPIVEQIPFVWAAPGTTNGWTAGSLVNGYTIGPTLPISLAVTGNTTRILPRNGINTPVSSTEFTGGGATQHSVVIYADFLNQSESLSITVNIGTPGTGVASLGFDIFDIDQW